MAVERYGSTRTDVIVKLVLVFFISLLSFSIGTFVGKKFSDNQHKLSQLEPAHQEQETDASAGERDVASISEETVTPKPEDALTDEEMAKLTQEFAAGEEEKPHGTAIDKNDTHEKTETHAKADSHGESAENATPAAAHGKAETKPATIAPSHSAATAHETVGQVAQGQGTNRHPSAAAEKVANDEDIISQKVEKVYNNRIPTSLPKQTADSTIGKFTVQVASYPKEEEAQKMASDLKTKGFSAFYVPAKVNGSQYYRVSVGIFATSKEATAFQGNLTARTKLANSIITKISKE